MERLKFLKRATENQELNEVPDLYTLPVDFFNGQVSDPQLKEMHRRLQAMPMLHRQALHFEISGIDPALARESLALDDPGRYWILVQEARELLYKDTDPVQIEKALPDYYSRCNILLEILLDLMDHQDKEAELRKRKNRRLAGVIVVIGGIGVMSLVFALLFRKAPERVFEEAIIRYPGLEAPAVVNGDSLYYHAWQLFMEEDYEGSYSLFDELLIQPEGYPSEAEWYMALISLQQGNRKQAIDHLRRLKEMDGEMYRNRGRWAWKRVKI